MEERLLRFYLTCSHHNQSPLKLDSVSFVPLSIHSFTPLKVKPKTLHMLGKCFMTQIHTQPSFYFGEKLPKEAPKL